VAKIERRKERNRDRRSFVKATTLSVSGTWSNRVKFRTTAMPAPDRPFDFTPGPLPSTTVPMHLPLSGRSGQTMVLALRIATHVGIFQYWTHVAFSSPCNCNLAFFAADSDAILFLVKSLPSAILTFS
jgi:hypothetical protein